MIMKIKLILVILVLFMNSPVYADKDENIIYNYCLGDYMGDRIRGKFSFSDTAWKEEPGWDSFDVIESFEIVKQEKNSVKVKYYIYGRMGGHDFTCSKKEEIVEFKIETKNKKRVITGPVIYPKVSTFTANEMLRQGIKNNPKLKDSFLKLKKCSWNGSFDIKR